MEEEWHLVEAAPLCVKGQYFTCLPEGYFLPARYSLSWIYTVPSCAQWMIPASIGSWVAPRGEWPLQPCVTCPWCSGWPSQHSMSECVCCNAPVKQIDLKKWEKGKRITARYRSQASGGLKRGQSPCNIKPGPLSAPPNLTVFKRL